GEPYQSDAIASCIIGGVSMSGGEGKIILVMLGALIIGSIRNILNLLAVHSFYQNILVGVIIITVVAISMMTRDKRAYRTAQFAQVKS
ncbi:MAG: ABC transporter permease, partial [Eubacteriales bacterium]|nr:ABC transporter permease [Eubacteriales bacterium]